ncbi:MAG: PKD domain-containing protein [Bacteroidales bacterium]
MVLRTIYIQLFLLLATICLSAQEHIAADVLSGCDTLQVAFSLDNAQPLESYSAVEWWFGDGATSAGTLSPTHTYNQPGLYDVRCVLNGTTVLEEVGFIELGERPYADFTFVDISTDDSEFRFRFETVYFNPVEEDSLNYIWRFPDGTEEYDSTAEYVFTDEGIYPVFLMLEGVLGCSDSITKKVPVSRQLMVPNVFSPNGDEINDYFEVTTPGDFTYTFKIFTREGLLIYSSMSPFIRWDGRFAGGREAPEGVYYYTIRRSDPSNEPPLSGFLHLFR